MYLWILLDILVNSATAGRGKDANFRSEDFLRRSSVVLKKYADNHRELHMHILYAFQSGVHQLEHPPGVFVILFVFLHTPSHTLPFLLFIPQSHMHKCTHTHTHSPLAHSPLTHSPLTHSPLTLSHSHTLSLTQTLPHTPLTHSPLTHSLPHTLPTHTPHGTELLSRIFHVLYQDLEIIDEATFLDWREKGTEPAGKGVAVHSLAGFYLWLESANQESDTEP